MEKVEDRSNQPSCEVEMNIEVLEPSVSSALEAFNTATQFTERAYRTVATYSFSNSRRYFVLHSMNAIQKMEIR